MATERWLVQTLEILEKNCLTWLISALIRFVIIKPSRVIMPGIDCKSRELEKRRFPEMRLVADDERR